MSSRLSPGRQRLGWRLDADRAVEDFRLIQFTPPGSGCSVQFGANLTPAAPGSAQASLLIVSDIEAAHDDLASRGVEISEVFHIVLGGGAAIAFAQDVLDGVTPSLTGPDTAEMAGVAAIATELTGRPVRRVVVSDADWSAALAVHGIPEAQADMLAGMFAASRLGHFAPGGPALASCSAGPPHPGRRPEASDLGAGSAATPARSC